MKKLISLNFGTIITFGAVVYVAYHLLLSSMHASITSIIGNSNHYKHSMHLLILGLLPVYIATIIFGSAIFAVYLGSSLQQFIQRTFKRCIDTDETEGATN